MPKPAEIQTYAVNLEIIPPMRFASHCQRCECCGESKTACCFEEDGFGICTACLESDVIILPDDPPGARGGRSHY
jgi:hypothetical protein